MTRGRINSMGATVILLTLAVALGGILEEIGSLQFILEIIMKKVSSYQLVTVTIFSSLVTALPLGPAVSHHHPGPDVSNAYQEFHLHPKNLGRVAPVHRLHLHQSAP